jgi:hypothetical protein
MLFTLATVAGLACSAGLVGAATAANASTAGKVSVPASIKISGVGRVNPGGVDVTNQSYKTANSTKQSPLTQLPTISENWSGYADIPPTTSDVFTSVHGRFTQPKITCTGVANQFTSNWVGLDGFDNETVEQDGTFAYCAGKHHNHADYYAWYEMYPAGSVEVFKVRPGNIIDASVTTNGSGAFSLTISDLTTGKSKDHAASCAISTCVLGSAEWIIERPATCNNSGTKCFLTELADFGHSQIREDTASLNSGPAENAGSFPNWPIYMVNNLKKGFVSLDTVSVLEKANRYTATWDRSGTTVPITLGPDS